LDYPPPQKSKAAEPERIQNIILQHLSQLVLKFNRSLELNYCSIQWKEAKIIMLPKPNKDNTPSLNYRPISLLNSLGKLFEKIILKILNFQLRGLKVIRNNKHGFKRGHSTTYELLGNAERMTQGFNNKATVDLFLDIECTFDKI
jgi:hypothetical protein